MARWLLAVVCLLMGLGWSGDPLLGKAQADLYLDNFAVTGDANNVVTISGDVYGADPTDLFVYIDGVLGESLTYVGDDGHFVIIVQVDPNVTGGVTAQAFTWYGDSSNVGEDVIN